MQIRNVVLADPLDLSHAVDGWEQVYRQIAPGRFECSLVLAEAPDFQFFREITNRRVVQAGMAPVGRRSLAVPLDAPMHGTFQGQRIDNFALMSLGAREDFRLYTPESMYYAGISLPDETLEELIALVVGEAAVHQVRKNVVPVSAARIAGLRSGLALLDSVAPWMTDPNAVRRFQHEVIGLMLQLLESPIGYERSLTHSTYSDIVRRAEYIACAQTDHPVTVLDLCVLLRCSRRTLQTSFQRVANVTPVEYLRSVRLNGVRQALRSSHAEELRIGDAAARWGFLHLGYFANEYRHLFGELPSATPRKR